VELQANIGEYERNGIAVFAISYDSVDVLRAFAEKYGIRFPLLSDEGSVVIRRLRLLNERLQEHHGFYGGSVREDQWGVPYPGSFILDEQGVTVEKRFEDSYRERETAVGILEAAFRERGSQHGAEATISAPGVLMHAYLDSPTYRSMQRLRLTVELAIAPGLHVYGQPIPDGYVPLSAEIAPVDGLVVGATELPAPHPFSVDGLDEQFHAYDGTVRLAVPLTFGLAAANQTIEATIRYQACSATDCRPPASLTIQLPVQVLNHVERPG
jgi:peroxiredoxin